MSVVNTTSGEDIFLFYRLLLLLFLAWVSGEGVRGGVSVGLVGV